IAASTVTNPIWYVKTRLQLDSRPQASPVTAWDIIKSTYREYGLRGFYRGISASYIGSLETALNFVVYEHVKGTLLFWGQRRNRQAEMAAAAEERDENWEQCAYEESEDSGQQFRGSQGGSKLSANSDMIICMGASAFSKFVAITVAYPHEINKQQRVTCCLSLRSRKLQAPFLDPIITDSDEKWWILYNNVKHKRQWLSGQVVVQSQFHIREVDCARKEFFCVYEVVRTRMRERGNKYRTFVGTFMTVLREETWRGLYRGLGTHYIRQVPNSCIMIGTYEWVVYFLHSWNLVAVRND
ncbi:hypothetical protein ACTXT7_015137, partial [Hymenolepis weldensis]